MAPHPRGDLHYSHGGPARRGAPQEGRRGGGSTRGGRAFWREFKGRVASRCGAAMEVAQAWAVVEAAAAALISGTLDDDLAPRLQIAAKSIASQGLTSVAVPYLLGAGIDMLALGEHGRLTVRADIVGRHFAATLIPRFLAEFTHFPDWKRTLAAEALEEKVEATLERQCHSLYHHFKFASLLLEELCSHDHAGRYGYPRCACTHTDTISSVKERASAAAPPVVPVYSARSPEHLPTRLVLLLLPPVPPI